MVSDTRTTEIMINREVWQDVNSPVPTDNPEETSEKHSVTGITLNNEVYMTGNSPLIPTCCFDVC